MLASPPRPGAWLLGFVAWAVLVGLLAAEYGQQRSHPPALKSTLSVTARARADFVIRVPEKARVPDPGRVPAVGTLWLEQTVDVPVARGRVLVAPSTRLTPFHRRLLRKARTAGRAPTASAVAVRGVLMLGLLLLLVWFASATTGSVRRVSVLLGLTVGSVAAALGVKLLTALPMACAPLALAPLLVGVAAGRRAALLSALGVSLLAALADLAPPPELWGLAAGASVAAVLTFRRRTGSVLIAAAVAGGVQAGIFLLVAPVHPPLGTELEGAVFYGGAGPWIAGGVGWLLTWPVLRWAGVASASRLRRLTAPGHPLLRELRRRARGTHEHAHNVARLAEAAQKALGADPHLLRAGAWYHDLGKLIGSDYFAENRRQATDADPHESLSCEASARRIARHVPDGLRLSRRYRLPPELRTLISEHHGTGSVHGPLERARREGRHIDPAVYYYPGPLPQSREAAILMVCDAVEAASRGLEDSSLAAVSAVVEEVVDRLMSEYQFERCELSQRALVALTEALIKAVRQGLHRRPDSEGGADEKTLGAAQQESV